MSAGRAIAAMLYVDYHGDVESQTSSLELFRRSPLELLLDEAYFSKNFQRSLDPRARIHVCKLPQAALGVCL